MSEIAVKEAKKPEKEVVVQCDNCALTLPLDKFTVHELGYYCQACVTKLFIQCDNCKNKIHKYQTNSIGEKDVCSSCIGEFYFMCTNCSMFVKEGEEHTEENPDTGDTFTYCADCHSMREVSGQIHDYNYIPKLRFNKLPHENLNVEFGNNTLTKSLGVELEINTNDIPHEHSRRFKAFLKRVLVGKDKKQRYIDCADRFYFKRDGSISCGYEIVTHPFTLQDSHKNIPWREILRWLRKNNATSYESKECGLHVHVSRDGMTPLEIGKIKLFFWRAKDQIAKFSKRKDFRYCLIEPFDRRSLLAYTKGLVNQDGRHVAVNVSNDKGTVEFRIFRGTLSYKRFIASLQFSQAVCEFVKEHGTPAIDSKWAWKLFCEWITKKGSYQILHQYLKKHVGTV